MLFKVNKVMKNKLDILYVSNLCSNRLIKQMLDLHTGLPNLAAQKYHKLLAQGMVLNENLFELELLSVPEYSKPSKGGMIFTDAEEEDGVKYIYSPILFVPLIKWLVISIFLNIKIFKWRFQNNHKNRYIVFDILNLSTSLTALFASKILGVKSIAIVTDLPEMMYVLQPKVYFTNRVTYLFKNFLLKQCSGYLFLTKEMDTYLNTRNKPFCIIEGLADSKIKPQENIGTKEHTIKIIHYSGGLYEKFGVKTLVEAFMLINRKDIKLHLFGNGDLVAYITKCKEVDSRIEFFGYQENNIVIDDQQNAVVLVNPRFSSGLYNKFSFPSKTIEYMVSGVPLLTTRLPGIPQEYFEFVHIFKEETIDGYRESMEMILDVPPNELNLFGARAKKFILENKNNRMQAEKFYKVFSN